MALLFDGCIKSIQVVVFSKATGQVTAYQVIEPYLCAKFQTCSSYGFKDTGIQTKEQEQEEELGKWIFCHISHVSCPILTKY